MSNKKQFQSKFRKELSNILKCKKSDIKLVKIEEGCIFAVIGACALAIASIAMYGVVLYKCHQGAQRLARVSEYTRQQNINTIDTTNTNTHESIESKGNEEEILTTETDGLKRGNKFTIAGQDTNKILTSPLTEKNLQHHDRIVSRSQLRKKEHEQVSKAMLVYPVQEHIEVDSSLYSGMLSGSTTNSIPTAILVPGDRVHTFGKELTSNGTKIIQGRGRVKSVLNDLMNDGIHYQTAYEIEFDNGKKQYLNAIDNAVHKDNEYNHNHNNSIQASIKSQSTMFEIRINHDGQNSLYSQPLDANYSLVPRPQKN